MTDLEIKTIAEECGFDSVEMFTSYNCPSDYNLTEHCKETKSCIDCWKLAEKDRSCCYE